MKNGPIFACLFVRRTVWAMVTCVLGNDEQVVQLHSGPEQFNFDSKAKFCKQGNTFFSVFSFFAF